MERNLVDTNVILRYLLQDDATLFKKASAILEKVKTGQVKVIILESVLTECVYVLLKVYKVKRPEIAESLGTLFHYKGIVNPDKLDLIDSIGIFSQTNLSFVDCILCTKSKNNAMPLYTFDEELARAAR
jgi:predicted nucleic-acid-binding protein